MVGKRGWNRYRDIIISYCHLIVVHDYTWYEETVTEPPNKFHCIVHYIARPFHVIKCVCVLKLTIECYSSLVLHKNKKPLRCGHPSIMAKESFPNGSHYRGVPL